MVKIDDKLKEEIKQYCTLNKLKMGEFVNKLLKEAFAKEKYGDRPPMFKKATATTTSITVIKSTTEPPITHEEPIVEEVPIETTTTTSSKIKRRIIKTT